MGAVSFRHAHVQMKILEYLLNRRIAPRDLDKVAIPTKLSLLPVAYIEEAVTLNEGSREVRPRYRDSRERTRIGNMTGFPGL